MIKGYTACSVGEFFWECRGRERAGPVLIAIHGGPGFSSYYLEPLWELSSGLPVALYDEAGCGRARRCGDRKLFTIGGFVEELECLRIALAAEQVILLGHSFGGLIAVEYALEYPSRVDRLILASVSIDISRWRSDAERLLTGLPLMSRMILREGERTGQIESPAYRAALSEYYQRHVYGFDEKPRSLQLSEEASDATTYTTMWGPNELVVTGVCRDYTISPRLPEVKCPTLLTCGRFDEATPEAHRFFATQIPLSRVAIFERSAHHPHLSEPEAYLATVREFLGAY